MTEQTGTDPVPASEEPPARVTGKLRWRFSHEIVPNFWEPGLIDGVLEKKGMTIVYGPSGCGKTAVVVDMAARIAAGMPWRGMKTTAGLVVYIAAENHWSTGNRMWAWRRRHDMREDVPIPLALVESSVSLTDDGNAAQEIVGLVRAAEASCAQECRLVVLDTLARTMTGDENTAKDMSVYVAQLDAIKLELDTHVMVVHHTGKDESRGARGSSALRAATDHEVELHKEQGSRVGRLKLSKIREGGLEGKKFGYELMPRVLGTNAYGREVTTVVVEEAEAPAESAGGQAGTVDGIQIRAVIDAADGRMSEKELKSKLVLRTLPESNRTAWKRAKDKGIYSVDEFGYVS